MKPHRSYILGGFLLILLPVAGFAQPAYEFANGSGPTTSGSSVADQVITFQSNALNPAAGTYTPLSPTVTATFAVSNQQYILPANQNPNGGSISFGAGNTNTSEMISSAPIFDAMNYVSGAPASDFSSTQDNVGTGISMADNYAVEVFTSAMGLYNANLSTAGTYYMANLTITFNVPLTNPIIHIVGLGGTSGALGFTTTLTLQTAGLTMTELSGSTEFSVAGGGTQIINTASAPTATTGAGAASGSVMINGSSVTSLTFEINFHGDGKTPTWSTSREHVGDAWMIAVSGLNTLITLPIGTTAFTAQPQQHTVDLQWATAAQQNSRSFTVERSKDGSNWTSIGQVTATANNPDPTEYNYVDRQPLTGANYYRLQEFDDDGSSIYSPVRNVNFAGTAITTSWYPNPTHDRLTISTNSNLRSITLTTLDGQTLQSFEGFASGQSIDMSRYPFGIYFLVIRTTDGQSQVAKIERN